MKIFLLEDDPIYLDVISSDLEKMGHTVQTYSSVEGAADEIKREEFDLICIDITLPYKKDEIGKEQRDGGICVLEELAEEGFSFPPTIFISVCGYKDVQMRVEKLVKDYGMNIGLEKVETYFQKPYDIEEFRKTISNIAEKAKHHG